MANSMSFGGIDLAAYGVSVERGRRALTPLVNTKSVPLGIGNGVISGVSSYGPRLLNYSLQIKGEDHADIKGVKLAALVQVLTASREDQKLILDESDDRYWWARLAAASDVSYISPRVGRVALSFVSGQSTAESVAELVKVDTLTTSGGAGNQDVPLEVGGEDWAYPVIEITPDAPTSNFAVSNEVLDLRFSWTAPGAALAAGDTVTIETDPRRRGDVGGQVFKIQRALEARPQIAMAGVEGLWPALASPLPPGVTQSNLLRFWGITGGVTITWRNSFLKA